MPVGPGQATAVGWQCLPRTASVAAGQLKFVGSFLYEEKGGGVFSRGSFDLKPTNKPSELEMLGRLNSVSDGTGWESSIRSRIRKLGGNPDKPAQKTSN